MKKVSLIALALSTVATWASAQAPVPVAVPATAVPCPCPKAFQGFFVGGNVGYGVGYGKTTISATNLTGYSRSHNLAVKGFDGGVNAGYTHRFGNFGLGAEFVANWTNTKGTYKDGTTEGSGTPALLTTTGNAKLKQTLQVRANFSYIICNLVAPKIILGWDNSQWERNVSATIPGFTIVNGTSKKRFNSFLWGAGVDFLLAKHVIAGLEYTGTWAGKKSFNPVATNPAGTATHSFQPQYNKFALTLKIIY